MKTQLFVLFVFLIAALLKMSLCSQQPQPNHHARNIMTPLSFQNQQQQNEQVQSLVPLWKKNIRMNLYIFINSELQFNDYSASPNWKIDIQNAQGLQLKKYMDLLLPKKSATTMFYAHIFLVKDSFPIDPTNKSFSIDSVVYVCQALTKFYHYNGHAYHNNNDRAVVPYWHNTITISLVHDSNDYISKDSLHPVTLKYFLNNLKKQRQRQQKVGFYRPIVFPNDFWLIKKDAHQINDTTGVLPLTIHLETINIWKFNVYAVLAAAKKEYEPPASAIPSITTSSIDEIKRILLNMNNSSFITAITLTTCLFHGLFEFLAFKNDISFWVKKTNRIGVSVNSIIMNIVIQTTLLVYHYSTANNNVLKSLMQLIRISIEICRLHRIFRYEYCYWIINIQQQSKTRFMVKLVRVETTNAKNTNLMIERGEKRTRQLDDLAVQHLLLYITAPLFIVYWCSGSTLHGFMDFLSTFGCMIVIGPQLHINYHMDMVNHVSLNTMIYKSINIAIDDLFGLAIGMPIIHRLSCANNNIVYLIYVLQKSRYLSKLTNRLFKSNSKKQQLTKPVSKQ